MIVGRHDQSEDNLEAAGFRWLVPAANQTLIEEHRSIPEVVIRALSALRILLRAID